ARNARPGSRQQVFTDVRGEFKIIDLRLRGFDTKCIIIECASRINAPVNIFLVADETAKCRMAIWGDIGNELREQDVDTTYYVELGQPNISERIWPE
ncbi:16616_t:CDS:2, partial [Entrophospora sp. SA101]